MTRVNPVLDPLGRAEIQPGTPVIVGSYGIDSGGQIKIALALVSDWEAPQFDRPDQSGFTTVTTDGPAKIAVSWQPLGYIRPWCQERNEKSTFSRVKKASD